MGRHSSMPVRRALSVGAVAVLAVTGVAVAVTPNDSGTTYAEWALMALSGDKDCTYQYFTSHEDAVAYFKFKGYTAKNDPEDLDRTGGNGDGNPCENLKHDPNYVNHWGSQVAATKAPATQTVELPQTTVEAGPTKTSAPRKHTRFDVPK